MTAPPVDLAAVEARDVDYGRVHITPAERDALCRALREYHNAMQKFDRAGYAVANDTLRDVSSLVVIR